MTDATPRRGLVSTPSRLLSRAVDRLAVLAIAALATVSALAESLLLVVISLAALRLSSDTITPVSFPLGLPIDELSSRLLLLVGLGALAVRLLFVLAGSYVAARLAESVSYRLRTRLIVSYQNSEYSLQLAQRDGYLQTLSQTNVNQSSSLVQHLSSTITSGISFSMFVLASLAINPAAAGGLILFGALMYALFRPVQRLTGRLSSIRQEASKEYARLLQEATAMSVEHRIIGSGTALVERLDRQLQKLAQSGTRQRVVQSVTPQTYTAVGYLAILGGIGIAGSLDPDEIATLGAIVLMMLRSIGHGQAFQATTQAIASAEPIAFELLNAIEEFEANHRTVGQLDAGAPEVIQLRAADLGYNEATILTQADLVIRSGESIGIVGPSGGGKTTLAMTLLGLLRPLRGEHLINGIPSTELTEAWWHSNVSFVPQDAVLFEGSVRENIVMHRPYTVMDINAAITDAHLDDEVAQWAGGIEHDVGPRGGRLSGGQRQRVCIARALVGCPHLLVMDEPTSSLDSSAEASISAVLETLRGSTTLVVIAHRVSTLASCDRVILIADGKIRELGTGASLQDDLAEIDRLFEHDGVIEKGAQE